MSRIITLFNGKGGSGKSPTAIHLAAALAGRVLLIDADQQGSTTLHLCGAESMYFTETFAEVVLEQRYVAPIQVKTDLFLLPANGRLARAEDDLPKDVTHPYQFRVRAVLRKFYADFDYIVIDTPGSHISVFSIMALVAADQVIVPAKPESAHIQATQESLSVIEEIQSELNPAIRVFCLLATQVQHNNHHASLLEMLAELKAPEGSLYPLYPFHSYQNVRYNDATSTHCFVYEFAKQGHLKTYWADLANALVTGQLPGAQEVK